ncbi:MAG: amidase [Gammaproteobacteria bacterium]
MVARVRREGAILLGKTNTPEFTLGGVAGIDTSSNSLYGSSHNPYDLTLTTSGSSGGAAAIVAAGGSAFDIGSDLGGSIRLPAHVNGVAGLKTTAGRVPRSGHVVDYGGVLDLWQQVGPIARRVEDLALIAAVISGPDYRDAACAPVPWNDPRKVRIDRLRVAYFATADSFRPDDATQATIRSVAGWLGESAKVTEACPAELFEALNVARGKLTMGDGWGWYRRLAGKWGTKNVSSEMAETIASTPQISTAEYVRVWEEADEIKSKLLAWMGNYDVFICPVSKGPATPIDRIFDPAAGGGDSLNALGAFNSTGWPVAVVRCGTSADGRLPIGVQIAAAPWREDVCLAVASHLEARSGGWRPPSI